MPSTRLRKKVMSQKSSSKANAFSESSSDSDSDEDLCVKGESQLRRGINKRKQALEAKRTRDEARSKAAGSLAELSRMAAEAEARAKRLKAMEEDQERKDMESETRVASLNLFATADSLLSSIEPQQETDNDFLPLNMITLFPSSLSPESSSSSFPLNFAIRNIVANHKGTIAFQDQVRTLLRKENTIEEEALNRWTLLLCNLFSDGDIEPYLSSNLPARLAKETGSCPSQVVSSLLELILSPSPSLSSSAQERISDVAFTCLASLLLREEMIESDGSCDTVLQRVEQIVRQEHREEKTWHVQWKGTCKEFSDVFRWCGLRMEEPRLASFDFEKRFKRILEGGICKAELGRVLQVLDLCVLTKQIDMADEDQVAQLLPQLLLLQIDVVYSKQEIFHASNVLVHFLKAVPQSIWEKASFLPRVLTTMMEALKNINRTSFESLDQTKLEVAINTSYSLFSVIRILPRSDPRCKEMSKFILWSLITSDDPCVAIQQLKRGVKDSGVETKTGDMERNDQLSGVDKFTILDKVVEAATQMIVHRRHAQESESKDLRPVEYRSLVVILHFVTEAFLQEESEELRGHEAALQGRICDMLEEISQKLPKITNCASLSNYINLQLVMAIDLYKTRTKRNSLDGQGNRLITEFIKK